MQSILLTGFQPFGGEEVNPSAEIALALDGEEIDRHAKVKALVLPVDWQEAPGHLLRAIAEASGPRPDGNCCCRPRRLAAVVMLGQAGGYPALGLERVAINVANGKDVAGVERVEEPIAAGGPPAYFSTLPLQAIVRRVEGNGLPAFISGSAGTYLCNYIFYTLMHHLATGWPDPDDRPLAGFIHLPYLPSQAVGKKPVPPSMSRTDMELAVWTALSVTLEQAPA